MSSQEQDLFESVTSPFHAIFPSLNEKEVPYISLPISLIDDIISEELKCPICWGTIEKTLAVSSCLHRFCTECLHRSLRVELGGQKTSHECPSCRAKMASRRDARPDVMADCLIDFFSALSRRSGSTLTESLQPLDLGVFRKLYQNETEALKRKSKELIASGKVWTFDPNQRNSQLSRNKKPRTEKTTSGTSTEVTIGPRICLALFPSPQVSRLANIVMFIRTIVKSK
jgi:hypothetical protein